MNEYDQYNKPEESAVQKIKDAAELQVLQQQKVTELKAALETAEAELKASVEDIIPELLENAGLQKSKITLDDGKVLSLKEEVKAFIPSETPEQSFNWLDEQGWGGMIKREVVIDFGKFSEERALEIKQELEERGIEGINIKVKKSVHFQTMCAFARGKLEEGVELPEDKIIVERKNKSIVK